MNTMLRYLDEIEATLAKVRRSQLENMYKAARMLADATISGQNLFVFGSNHAGILALELYYRTGGLVNMNPIRGPGLNLDVTPADMSSQFERMEGYGKMLINYSPLRAGDVLLIHSVSGRNQVSIDAAGRAREIGVKVIVLTNMATSKSVISRHQNGKKLYELADLVIDNCGQIGDAALQLPGTNTRVGPTSTAIGAVILNAIVCEAAELIISAGLRAPVFVSANIDGGDEQNKTVLEAYKDHIFYM